MYSFRSVFSVCGYGVDLIYPAVDENTGSKTEDAHSQQSKPCDTGSTHIEQNLGNIKTDHSSTIADHMCLSHIQIPF